MTRHGQLYLRDQTPPRSVYYDSGRFGRLFPHLPPFAANSKPVRDNLMKLGKVGGLMDAKDPAPAPGVDPIVGSAANKDNVDPTGDIIVTAGFTFLGQFLDHDMTFDPTSSLERQNDPESIANFRTPFLELDSVYGSGRAVSPHFYDSASGNLKFLIDEDWPDDLPRNSQNTALIADPRNDENLILSQLHLAFLKFHNRVVDCLQADGMTDNSLIFTEAQCIVRWHYQWIILHEYLPTTVGQDLVNDILANKRKFYDWRNEPFIPVEHSVAAFRFGHSQVRPGYIANHAGDGGQPFKVPIFNFALDPNDPDPDDLRGGKRAARRFVDWDTFFDFENANLRPNKQIDTKLSSVLFTLPPSAGLPGMDDLVRSLAQRNLLRHLTFDLPSGQDVARAMSIEPLSPSQLSALEPLGFAHHTPLWFYLLKEAELMGAGGGGRRLGPVGGRIVAEVFIGLLQGDHKSFLCQHPKWKPNLGEVDDFKMVDLLKFAGVAPAGVAQTPCPQGIARL